MNLELYSNLIRDENEIVFFSVRSLVSTGARRQQTPQLRMRLMVTSKTNTYLSPVWDLVWTAASLNSGPRSGVLRTHKLKTHLLRTQNSKVLPF